MNKIEITITTIKSYTDLEQSKKLAKILPLESADMQWIKKQGESKPILNFKAKDWYVSKIDGKIHNIYHSDKFEPKFHEGDKIHCKLDDRTFVIKEVDLKNGVYLYTENGYSNDIDYADEMFELVEQKTAEWSAEDEKNLTKCLETLIAQTESVDLETINKEWKPAIDWLKSIKQRIRG